MLGDGVGNSLGIDFEQWFDRPVLQPYIGESHSSPADILPATKEILKVLRECHKVTTFFATGEVAREAPEALEQIVKEGHEIGCHGLVHKTLPEIGKARFADDLQKACDIIRHVTGESPRGFRAPECSVGRSTPWAIPILEQNGFSYDSSIIPGVLSKTPQRVYLPSTHNPTVEDVGSELSCIELPLLTYDLGVGKIPAAGGFYFRLFGTAFIAEAIRRTNRKGRPAVCYFHPWELSGFPPVSMPVAKRMFAYYKIPCLREFEHLIRSVKISPARDIASEGA